MRHFFCKISSVDRTVCWGFMSSHSHPTINHRSYLHHIEVLPIWEEKKSTIHYSCIFLRCRNFPIECVVDISQTTQTFLQFGSRLCIIKCFRWDLLAGEQNLCHDVFFFNKTSFHTSRTYLWSILNEQTKRSHKQTSQSLIIFSHLLIKT